MTKAPKRAKIISYLSVMKHFLFFLLTSVCAFAQPVITPITNPIPGYRITDAVVFHDTLFLTAGNQLWGYNGSSFFLKKMFDADVKALLVDQNTLFVFYKYRGGSIWRAFAHSYNGLWKTLYAPISGGINISKVLRFNNLFYGACGAYTQTRDPYNSFSWCGDSCMISGGGFGSSVFCFPYSTSLTEQNGQLVVSGFSDDCNESIETITGPYSNFNGGLASSYQNNYSRLVMHEWFKGKMYAYGVFDTASGVSLNNNAVWDGTNWSRFNHPVFDSTDYLLSMSSCDHLIFAFPGYDNSSGTTIKVVYGNEFGWYQLSYEFYTPKTYPASAVLGVGFSLDSIYQLKTISYNGTVYLYGDLLTMDGNRVFNKFGKMPEFIGLEENVSTQKLSLYPNPTAHFLSIEGSTENARYTIYNLQSVVVKTGSLSKQIDVSNLPSGVYVFQREAKDAISRQRFVKTD